MGGTRTKLTDASCSRDSENATSSSGLKKEQPSDSISGLTAVKKTEVLVVSAGQTH